MWAHRPTWYFRSPRRAACPHAADSPNFMCSNGKTRPHPARCATFSPGAKATTGFSSRRSCHEVTDEVKICGLMLFPVRHCVGRHALMPPNLTPPSRLCRVTSPKVEAMFGFSSRRSCHGVTDEVKFCSLMSFSARHCIGRHALMPPNENRKTARKPL